MPAEKVEQIQLQMPIDEGIEYQEKGWQIQRAATYIIFGLVILIAMGLFRGGPLAHKTVQQDGVVISYERLVHHNGTTYLDVSAAAAAQVTVISFPLHYMDHFAIETVVPEPAANQINGQEIVYVFNTSQAARITFTVSPVQWGRYNGELKVNGVPLPLSYFTYP